MGNADRRRYNRGVGPADHQPRPRERLLALSVLGLALEAVYLVLTVRASLFAHLHDTPIDIVAILGANTFGLLSFALPVTAAFAGYGLALLLARRLVSRRARVLVLGFATAHAITLTFMFPALALDIFHYIADARTLWVYHQNPLTVPPDVHPEGGVYPYVAWYHQPSPYGPLWSTLTILTRPAGLNSVVPPVIAFKGLVIAFYLGSAVLVYDIVRRTRPGLETFAALFFLWNPLVLLEVAGNGHNDIVMMFLVLLALAVAQRNLVGPAMLLLFASALIKFVSLLLVPLLALHVLRTGDRRARVWTIAGLVAGLAVVALAYLPFWEGLSTLDTARHQSSILANSPAAVTARLLSHAVPLATAERITRGAFGGLFGALYLAVLWTLLRQRRSFESLLAAMTTALFFYLAVAAFWFQPWYLVWLLPLAALLPHRRLAAVAAVFTLTAALMYIPVDFIWQTYFSGPTWPHRLALVVVFPLPALVWAWSIREGRPPGESGGTFEEQASSSPDEGRLQPSRRPA